MKTHLLYSLLLSLLVAGCQKSIATQENVIKEGRFLSAAKNNTETWLTNEPFASLSKTDKLIWVGGSIKNNSITDDYETLSMQLSITDLADLKKTTIKTAEYTFIIQEDIINDRYVLDTTNPNSTIEITEIDETNKIIKGKFNFYLVRDKWFSGNNEQVTFKSGEFVSDYTE
jgi:Family of unknown function (DUF6252)